MTDFSPLRVFCSWTNAIGTQLELLSTKIPFIQVDSHNIVPCWIASSKLEYSARTIRLKINNLLKDYLISYPQFVGNNHIHSKVMNDYIPIDWTDALNSLEINRSIIAVDWIKPGETEAYNMLLSFVTTKLKTYSELRNNPNENVASNLSPYFHFGQISSQTVILYMKSLNLSTNIINSFIEETIIRKELSDNFCYCKLIIKNIHIKNKIYYHS